MSNFQSTLITNLVAFLGNIIVAAATIYAAHGVDDAVQDIRYLGFALIIGLIMGVGMAFNPNTNKIATAIVIVVALLFIIGNILLVPRYIDASKPETVPEDFEMSEWSTSHFVEAQPIPGLIGITNDVKVSGTSALVAEITLPFQEKIENGQTVGRRATFYLEWKPPSQPFKLEQFSGHIKWDYSTLSNVENLRIGYLQVCFKVKNKNAPCTSIQEGFLENEWNNFNVYLDNVGGENLVNEDLEYISIQGQVEIFSPDTEFPESFNTRIYLDNITFHDIER